MIVADYIAPWPYVADALHTAPSTAFVSDTEQARRSSLFGVTIFMPQIPPMFHAAGRQYPTCPACPSFSDRRHYASLSVLITRALPEHNWRFRQDLRECLMQKRGIRSFPAGQQAFCGSGLLNKKGLSPRYSTPHWRGLHHQFHGPSSPTTCICGSMA